MIDLLTDYTVQNVILASVFLGLITGVLGCFAVLRQQSLLGDTLAHAALPGVCIGFLLAGTRDLAAITAGALATAVAAALLMVFLTRATRIKTDAGLGIALSLSFALGVVLLTAIQSMPNASQGGLDSFLFGQAAAVLSADLYLMGGLTVLALALVALLWKEFKLIAFDPLFAGSIGLPVLALEVVLTVTIAVAVVVGLQMVGVVLMAAMVIAPPVAARQWVGRLGHMVLLSAGFGIASGMVGALISASARNLSTGPLIVLVASFIVLVSLLIAPGRGILWEQVKRWRDSRQLRGQQLLETFYALAAHHRDPAYPAEVGMFDAYHGRGTRGALKRLQRRGLIAPVEHMPQEGPHWELTQSGRAAAERSIGSFGGEANDAPPSDAGQR